MKYYCEISVKKSYLKFVINNIFTILVVFFYSQLPLIAKAQSLEESKINEIAYSPEWDSLLHYSRKDEFLNQDSTKVNRESFIDGKKFFLAENGKNQPVEELKATIVRFRESDKEVICRFPARFEYLKDKFNLPGDLSQCTEMTEWLNALAPKTLSIIYADSFLNNPASLFGHTFIKLNSENGTPLIDYIVQYHAAVGKEPGLVFAMKGVFGGYNGYFQIAPYYESITKYNDYEQRDIWEYKLNLTESEIHTLLLHLWELREVAIDYFYFDENCSYHILSLLKVARPSLRLYDDLLSWIIPLDTLKAILKNDDILSDVIYRPSRSSKLIAREKELTGSEVKLAKEIAKEGVGKYKQELKELDEPSQAKVLEASGDFFEYLRLRKQSSANLLEILSERSKLPQRDKPFAVTTPEVKPDQAHDSRRFATERGFHSKRGVFIAGEIRPAYHDLLDISESFPAGSAIEVGKTKFRWMQSRGVELNKLSLVKINSYTPDTAFISKYSWDLGVQVQESELARAGKTSSFDLGFGKSFAIGSQKNLLSVLPRIKYEAGGGADEIAPGLSLTLIFQLSEKFRVRLQHENYYIASGRNELQYSTEISAFYPFFDDSGITFRAIREMPFGERGTLGMTGWQWYF